MAAAQRRKSGRSSRGTPAWLWLLGGILLGLGLAYYLWSKGFIPQPRVDSAATEESSEQISPTGGDEVAPASNEPRKSPYDFFTVLPEMEVVVPAVHLTFHVRRGTLEREEPPASTAEILLKPGATRELEIVVPRRN